MKKTWSLLKACFASNMNMFKISSKGKNRKSLAVVLGFLVLILMFYAGASMSVFFEQSVETHSQKLVLTFFAFISAVIIVVEGIYKSGSLLFNCKDDDLLLSLPIKKRTILFIRIFKFYLFELLFHAILFIPLVITYVNYADSVSWTFYLTSVIMFFTLPIIPIVLSCIFGALITGFSSRFKYKNILQIIISMAALLACLYYSINSEAAFNNIMESLSSINDVISKIFYPATLYGDLAVNFNILHLLLYILVSVIIFVITIIILSKFYFKINSRLKKAPSNKLISVDNLKIQSKGIYRSLIHKEIKQFFNIPVFIINAGFGLVLFILGAIILLFKYDSIISTIIEKQIFDVSTITSLSTIVVLVLITATSYMTSITNSVISLEGKHINILKTLPISAKTTLMSKVLACSLITFPVLFIGTTALAIRLKISIINYVMLIILAFLIPLVSHFIGILVNLKYPKFDSENSAEVVKQSTSSAISVLIGFVLMGIFGMGSIMLGMVIESTGLLIILVMFYLVIDYVLYKILDNKGTKIFNTLSV